MSVLLMTRRAGGAAAAGFEWLRPTTTLPTGLTFNASNGMITGTVLNTTEPTWATIDTSLTDTGNKTTNRTNLQNLVNSLASGLLANTLIQLPITGHFSTGSINLPAKSSPYYLGIRTPNHASLPTPTAGTFDGVTVPNKTSRVSSTHSADTTELRPASNNAPTITTSAGATKYWLRGLAFTNPGNILLQSALVDLRAATVTTVADLPSDIVVQQCYFHGGMTSAATATVRAGVRIDGQRIAVVDCTGEAIHESGAESKWLAVSPSGSPGVFKFVNNSSKIAGGSIHTLVGGAALRNDDAQYVEADIENRWNEYEFPAAYDAWFGSVGKNYFELKRGVRVLSEANRGIRHPGTGGQEYGWVVKLTDQDGLGVNARCNHVLYRFNYLTSTKASFTASGIENSPNLTVEPAFIEYAHNVSLAPSGTNRTMQIITVEDAVVEYNTTISSDNGVYFGGATADAERVKMRYNVFSVASGGSAGFGIFRDSMTSASLTMAVNTDAVFTDNLFANVQSSASYTGNTVVTAEADLYLNADGSAQVTSPAYQAGPSGRDLGVYFPLFNTLHAGID
jgi:hypothetical protein